MRKKEIKKLEIAMELRKMVDDYFENGVKPYFDAASKHIDARMKADKNRYDVFTELWNRIKQLVDTVIVGAVAAAGGGPAGGLIAKGILSGNPFQLFEGIAGVPDSDHLKAVSPYTHEGIYHPDAVVTGPAFTGPADEAIYRVETNLQNLSSIVKSMIDGLQHPVVGSPGSMTFNTGISRQEGEKLISVIEILLFYFLRVNYALKLYGEYLFVPYLVSQIAVNDPYDSNHRYFYWCKAGLNVDLDKLEEIVANSKNFDKDYKQAGHDVIKEYGASFWDQTLKHGMNRTLLFETHNAYPDYSKETIKYLRLHQAGFIKYSRIKGKKPYVRDSNRIATRTSKVDLTDSINPGDHALKEYLSELIQNIRTKKATENVIKFGKPKMQEKFKFKDLAIERSFISIFLPQYSIVYGARILYKTYHTSGQNHPIRRALGSIKSNLGKSYNERERINIFLGWYIVHKFFELHTGSPIPILLPPTKKTHELTENAIADILSLADRTNTYTSSREKIRAKINTLRRKHSSVVEPDAVDETNPVPTKKYLQENAILVGLLGTPGISEMFSKWKLKGKVFSHNTCDLANINEVYNNIRNNLSKKHLAPKERQSRNASAISPIWQKFNTEITNSSEDINENEYSVENLLFILLSLAHQFDIINESQYLKGIGGKYIFDADRMNNRIKELEEKEGKTEDEKNELKTLEALQKKLINNDSTVYNQNEFSNIFSDSKIQDAEKQRQIINTYFFNFEKINKDRIYLEGEERKQAACSLFKTVKEQKRPCTRLDEELGLLYNEIHNLILQDGGYNKNAKALNHILEAFCELRKRLLQVEYMVGVQDVKKDRYAENLQSQILNRVVSRENFDEEKQKLDFHTGEISSLRSTLQQESGNLKKLSSALEKEREGRQFLQKRLEIYKDQGQNRLIMINSLNEQIKRQKMKEKMLEEEFKQLSRKEKK